MPGRLRNEASAKQRPAPPRLEHSSSVRAPARKAPPRIGRRPSRAAAPVDADESASNQRPELDFSSPAVLERLFLRMPVRLLRAGNNALDLLFYDVYTIPADAKEIVAVGDPDGSPPWKKASGPCARVSTTRVAARAGPR